jgi:hypothetical protein
MPMGSRSGRFLDCRSGPGSDTVHLHLSTKDQDGTAGSNYDETLPPNGHTSFVLGAGKKIVPTDFMETI